MHATLGSSSYIFLSPPALRHLKLPSEERFTAERRRFQAKRKATWETVFALLPESFPFGGFIMFHLVHDMIEKKTHTHLSSCSRD